MSNSSEKKLIPFPILIISISVGVLGVLLAFDLPPVSAYERQLLKDLILILLFIIFSYFILRAPIKKIREKIFTIVNNKLFDSKKITALIPEDFAQEIVKEKGFAFCYPKTWFLTAACEPGLYKEAREQLLEPGISGTRNFNISYHDIRLAPDLEKMFKAIINAVLEVLKSSKLEFKQSFKNDQFLGMRYKVVYRNAQGLDLACYQVVLTNQHKRNMLIFTFTSQTNDFDKSKPLFDKIAGLAKIFD
ncbi:MAG: hypothetical protein V1747_07795 [Candidatus Omnitrophota bacterium]